MFEMFKYLIFGFLLLSPYYVNMPYPLNSFEFVLFVFFIVFFRKLNWGELFSYNYMIIYYPLLIIVGIIGYINMGMPTLDNFYRMMRGWFLIVICSALFYKTSFFNKNKLFWLSLGTIIGGVFQGVWGLHKILDNETAYMCPNIVALPICVFLSFEKKLILKVSVMLIVLLMGALSQTRGIMIYCILSYILSYSIYTYSVGKKVFNKSLLLIFSASVALYISYVSLENYVYSQSTYLHYRLYGKVKEFGKNESDENRINAYKYYIDYPVDYLLPNGAYLVNGETEWEGKNYNVNGVKASGVTDSGYCELFYTFGILLFIIILFKYLNNIRKIIKKLKLNNTLISATLVTGLFLLFALLMGYAIFSAPYTSFMWGVFFALIKTINKKVYEKV